MAAASQNIWASQPASWKIILKCATRRSVSLSLNFSGVLCYVLPVNAVRADGSASWSGPGDSPVKSPLTPGGRAWTKRLPRVPSTAPSPSSHCARCQEGTQMEQGDFVPISKNLTTQLGETDGNNYNKAEKNNLIQQRRKILKKCKAKRD